MRRSFVLAAALALGLAAQPASAAETYRFMTGPQGGGGTFNFTDAIEQGKAEIGFGNSISTVDGIQGTEPFKAKTTNVCQMASLYPQYFKVVVLADAGINSIADLKGKSVAIQTRGNTAEVATQHARANFDQQTMCESTLAVYEEALGRRGSQQSAA